MWYTTKNFTILEKLQQRISTRYVRDKIKLLRASQRTKCTSSPSLSFPSMESTRVCSILLTGFDTTSDELSTDTFGLITFRSFVAGMLLFRNSNNLSSLLFSVRATLGGVLVPEGGRRDLMGTVGPPECRKKWEGMNVTIVWSYW